jgi:hypothetical protein
MRKQKRRAKNVIGTITRRGGQDLDRAAENWKRLGSTVSRARHAQRRDGSGNYTIMLDPDYTNCSAFLLENLT